MLCKLYTQSQCGLLRGGDIIIIIKVLLLLEQGTSSSHSHGALLPLVLVQNFQRAYDSQQRRVAKWATLSEISIKNEMQNRLFLLASKLGNINLIIYMTIRVMQLMQDACLLNMSSLWERDFLGIRGNNCSLSKKYTIFSLLIHSTNHLTYEIKLTAYIYRHSSKVFRPYLCVTDFSVYFSCLFFDIFGLVFNRFNLLRHFVLLLVESIKSFFAITHIFAY